MQAIATRHHVCTVCARGFEKSSALTTKESIRIVTHHSNVTVKGFTYTLHMCSTCRCTYGEPLRVLHRPYETDLAEFTRSKKVIELKGTGPRD